MNQFFKRLFYQNVEITQCSAVAINNAIKEKVYLKIRKQEDFIDVTETHWVLCLEPIVFGVWLTNDKASALSEEVMNDCRLYFKSEKGKVLAIIEVTIDKKIEEKDGIIVLVRYKSSKLFHVIFFESYFLFFRYYRKPTLAFKKFKSLVAAYSYPRKVRIISFKKGEYINIFPMDFIGIIPGNHKRYVFGLRHTNQTLNMILEARKLVVSEVPSQNKEYIYQMGKHHGGVSPTLETLPFKTSSSKNYDFPVPEWAIKYNEIRILQNVNLGSHMLLFGESETEEVIGEQATELYHVHFLLFLYRRRNTVEYPLV